MKNLKLFGLMAIFAMFMTACEEDLTTGGGGGTLDRGPSVLLLSEDGFLSFDADIAPGQNIKVKLDAAIGDAALRTVSILEDGTNVSFDRITVNGTGAAANPILLFAPDTQGLTWEIEIMAPTDTDAHTYAFLVADENGKSDQVSINITRMLDSTPPSISIVGSGSYFAPPNSLVCINLNVSQGGTALTTIEVLEDDITIADASRLYFGDTQTNFDANPYTIPQLDQAGFEKPVYVRTGEAGVYNYILNLTDQFGNVQSVIFDIQSGTALSQQLTGVLLNSAGPAGTGGLDLETGNGTGSSDASADIKDQGIDTNELPGDNWIQRISGANGAVVKDVVPGQGGLVADFIYDWATSKEELVEIFDAGVSFASEFSAIVNVGDMFTVYNGTNYFLIEVTQVNTTSDNNEDNYVFNVKY